MLKTRLITAFILIPLVLLALFQSSPLVWRLIVLAVTMIAAWEWTALASWVGVKKWAFVALIGAAFPVLLSAWQIDLVKAIVATCTIGFWMLLVPVWLAKKAKLKHSPVMLITGFFTLLPFSLGLVFWREIVWQASVGAYLLLLMITVVAIADTSAYFAGRRFGKHKLAPAISPGKTIEGAIGAFVGVSILMLGIANLPAIAALNISIVTFIVIALIATPLSIMGDLYESWLKRCAGIKDSSQLLPGHGGVLDRLDALMPVISVSIMCLELYRSW
ncbi:phosphatidate cytidylyltransferase [Leeia sp. TBRC 13508]|uniref:Phosphatidate cytidylyltransferase n=1 Tax=Leeia speluncae TaxID=2884804 RepID=A0ABS8D639_9NEIS|nr:phosphatidate cytidylyltransferase [Leeia speluncae]MCB6183597.1 phosphatidate cytidylyltransferase [Leeia speluncae]